MDVYFGPFRFSKRPANERPEGSLAGLPPERRLQTTTIKNFPLWVLLTSYLSIPVGLLLIIALRPFSVTMQASEPGGNMRVVLRACQACSTSKSKCVPATDLTEGKCLRYGLIQLFFPWTQHIIYCLCRCFKSRRDCLFPEKSTKKRKAPTST